MGSFCISRRRRKRRRRGSFFFFFFLPSCEQAASEECEEVGARGGDKLLFCSVCVRD